MADAKLALEGIFRLPIFHRPTVPICLVDSVGFVDSPSFSLPKGTQLIRIALESPIGDV